MAASVATLTVNNFPDGKDLTYDHLHLYGTVALSAGLYGVYGVPLNWNILGNYGLVPSWAEFRTFGSPPGKYVYVWDKSNDTLRILCAQNTAATGTAPFSELSNGEPIPDAVVNDVIAFHAVVRRA